MAVVEYPEPSPQAVQSSSFAILFSGLFAQLSLLRRLPIIAARHTMWPGRGNLFRLATSADADGFRNARPRQRFPGEPWIVGASGGGR